MTDHVAQGFEALGAAILVVGIVWSFGLAVVTWRRAGQPAKAYYRLDPGDPSSYFDTTSSGNSLNAGNPVTLQLIMDSLRYWLTEMHVDGFRPLRMKTPATAAAPSAFKRFLQLAADFVGGGVHRALRDFGGTRKRLVESFFDGRLANHDEPCLVSSE